MGNYIFSPIKFNFFVRIFQVLWKKGAEFTPEERAYFSEVLTAYYQELNEANTEKRASSLLDSFSEYSTTSEQASTKENKGFVVYTPSFTSFCNFLEAFDVLYGKGGKAERKEYVRASKYVDLDSFLVSVDAFRKGVYAKVLNAPHTFELSNAKFLVFDVNGIKDDPILFPLICLLLVEVITDQIAKFPDVRKGVYIDEAWSLMDMLGSKIGELYRTIRKENGSVAIITQSIDEVLQSEQSAAIIANADTKLILGHKGKGESMLDQLCSVLGFTAHYRDLIESIRWEDPVSREVFLMQGNIARVFKIGLTIEEYASMTTTPNERTKLDKLIEYYGGRIAPAIDQFAEDKALEEEIVV